MHIGLICSEYPPSPHGGIGSFSQDFVETLLQADHMVTVVGVYPQHPNADDLPVEDTSRKGLRILRLPPSSRRILRSKPRMIWERYRLSRCLKRLHANTPFDIVECPDYYGWLSFGAPANVPVVVRLHGSATYFAHELKRKHQPLIRWLEHRTLEQADLIISVSQYTAEVTQKIFGLKAKPFHVVYNAIDTELFAPAPAEQVDRSLILFVNSISPRKGVEQLIRAMNIVKTTHPNARLDLIGKSYSAKDGLPYEDYLKQLVQPAFRDDVRFLGSMDRLSGVLPSMQQAAVCCYPSHSEAFAIGPLEAMALGKATIYTKYGSGSEAIEDGVSGLLCDPTDPADIAQKICYLLDNPQVANALGSAARQRVVEKFDRRNWLVTNLESYQAAITKASFS